MGNQQGSGFALKEGTSECTNSKNSQNGAGKVAAAATTAVVQPLLKTNQEQIPRAPPPPPPAPASRQVCIVCGLTWMVLLPRFDGWKDCPWSFVTLVDVLVWDPKRR